MNPTNGNMMYQSNPLFSWPYQYQPSINYSQDQLLEHTNYTPIPTFPSSSYNFVSFQAFNTLESTSYQLQEAPEMSIPLHTPHNTSKLISIVPDSTVVVQVVSGIESGSEYFKNGVKELYTRSQGFASNDSYQSIRWRLMAPFPPYLEVSGCWPDEHVQDDEAKVRNVGNKRKSRKKKNLLACISWKSVFSSHSRNPKPPLLTTTKNLMYMFSKKLSGSDVNHYKRIILPKPEVEKCLPFLEEKTGTMILVRDVLLSVTWSMNFRFWCNNNSRIYVLEHTGDFVKKHGLKGGDSVALFKDDTDHLYIYAKKQELPDSNPEQVIPPPSQEATNVSVQNPIYNPFEALNTIQNPFEASNPIQNPFEASNPIEDQNIGTNGFINAGGQPNSSNQQASMGFTDISNIEKFLMDDTDYNGLNDGQCSSSQTGFGNFNTFENTFSHLDYVTAPTTNNNGFNPVEEPLFVENCAIPTTNNNGLMDFNAINGSLLGENYGLNGNLNANYAQESSSIYWNELFEESPCFDEHGLSRVDLRPGNQDDYFILK